MRVFVASFLVGCALIASLVGAPMDFKELEFLIRQQTAENDIVREVATRRLVAPIDARVEQALKAIGATDGLLTRLKAPTLVLSPEESRAELERTSGHRARVTEAAAQDARTRATLEQQNTRIAQSMKQTGAIRQMLEGRLVKLDGDQVKPYDPRELEKVRLYAFYYSAMWCAPCRKFTPDLVAAYKEIKAKYPEFEVIFVSQDRDEFNMGEYMRSHKMPWPAVRFGAVNEAINQYLGEGIPWLVAVNDSGLPLTANGKDKKYLPPEQVVEAIRYMLRQVAPGR
jgi:thiol-disulfide isomerase/thioredoxin